VSPQCGKKLGYELRQEEKKVRHRTEKGNAQSKNGEEGGERAARRTRVRTGERTEGWGLKK